MKKNRATLGAAALVAVEGAAISLLVGMQIFDVLQGNAGFVTTALALIALNIAFAGAVIVCAVGLTRSRSWARSGALVLQIMVFVIGYYLLDKPVIAPGWLAWSVIAFAVVTFVTVLFVSRTPPDENDEFDSKIS